MRSKSTDYIQNPQQKVSLKLLFLSLIVSSRRILTFDLVSQEQRERFLSADIGRAIVLTTQRSQIAIFFRTFSVGFLLL